MSPRLSGCAGVPQHLLSRAVVSSLTYRYSHHFQGKMLQLLPYLGTEVKNSVLWNVTTRSLVVKCRRV
jgi:hypothetical protein